MQKRRPILPPSAPVLVLLPLSLIDTLDQASDALNMSRSDVIRRSLTREASSVLREEVRRVQNHGTTQVRPTRWSI